MDILAVTPGTHTIGNALFEYLNLKVHSDIRKLIPKDILVRGKHERKKSIVSDKEKTGKLFNYYRPTLEYEKNGIVYINCYPGISYVRHYANILANYYALIFHKNVKINIELPEDSDTKNELYKSNLCNIPTTELTIIGNVDKFSKFISDNNWKGNGDFRWKLEQVGKYEALLLGCRFSYWGDISGKLIEVLSEMGHKNIVYCGKVGGLKKSFITNETIVTGNYSYIENRMIKWKNLINASKLDEIDVVQGKHVNSYSVLEETKSWLLTNKRFHFVDPEIGYMALASLNCNVNFGFLHVISNNLTNIFNENLGNERNSVVLKKRNIAFENIWVLLQQNFS